MNVFNYKNKKYTVDSAGFLLNHSLWDENFAEGMASNSGILFGLIGEHWNILNSIRQTFKKTGKIPLVYQTCKMNGMHLKEMKNLFPSGYLRGACKLAGITYKEGYLKYSWLEASLKDIIEQEEDNIYRVDVRGFLIYPFDWDENWAIHKADEMKMTNNLQEHHWAIIRFLRDCYKKNKTIPTIYETCDENSIELKDMEELFPDGYHRGAIKIAGLRER
jgi:tRNA 2-thiouridine synthesizing protein E